ncbi:MAG: hypothetical protein ACR2I5_11735 [Candidatus Limnocylindria bacterium]
MAPVTEMLHPSQLIPASQKAWTTFTGPPGARRGTGAGSGLTGGTLGTLSSDAFATRGGVLTAIGQAPTGLR